MKRFVLFLFGLFICIGARAETVNLSWYVDNQVYQTTTCETGGNVTPQTAPNKKGYTFQEWLAYTPIEYLESTGTQYIDTGIRFSNQNHYRIVIKYKYKNISRGQSIAGAQPSYCFIPYTSADGIVSIYHSSLRGGLGTNISANTVYTLEMTQKGGVFTLNINGITKTATTTAPSSVYPYFLFATSKETSAIEFANAIIYFAKIYDNDVLVRDMIPVLDSNGTPCMYDKVEDKFYYNAGTGQFIAGPIINE